MKKVVFTLAVMVLGSFLVLGSADAINFIEIGDPILGSIVFSPDSNQIGEPTTAVGVAPTGSVTIGAPAAEGDLQPSGIYGVGVALANLGLVPWYEIAFDINFASYDAATDDLFSAVVTQGDYIWNSGSTVIGGYTWGGANYPGVEYDFSLYGTQAKVFVTPGLDYYLQAVLQTSDTLYPSWGTFSDFSVNVVPEPATMLLLGSGLLGLAGLRRKRRKS